MPANRPQEVFGPLVERVVLALVGAGAPLEDAAAYVDSSATAFRGFARRNKDFRHRLARAEREGELALLGDIAEAARTDPEAAQWLLDHADTVQKAMRRANAAPPSAA